VFEKADRARMFCAMQCNGTANKNPSGADGFLLLQASSFSNTHISL
jgi:hypothetical protein